MRGKVSLQGAMTDSYLLWFHVKPETVLLPLMKYLGPSNECCQYRQNVAVGRWQNMAVAPLDMSGATVSRETEPELRMNQRVPHQRVIQLV